MIQCFQTLAVTPQPAGCHAEWRSRAPGGGYVEAVKSAVVIQK